MEHTQPTAAAQRPPGLPPVATRAADGIRTHDLVLTKDALYRLSYSSDTASAPWRQAEHHGRFAQNCQPKTMACRALRGTPPPDPAALQRGILLKAGEGNRTLTTSLEGWSSAIELRPQSPRQPSSTTSQAFRAAAPCPQGRSRSLTGRLVGAGFEPAKAEPPDLQSGPFDRSGIPPKLARDGFQSPLADAQLFICQVLAPELAVGFEPTTSGLQNRSSAVELR